MAFLARLLGPLGGAREPGGGPGGMPGFGGNLPDLDRLLIAQAIVQGDHGAAAQLMARRRAMAAERPAAKQAQGMQAGFGGGDPQLTASQGDLPDHEAVHGAGMAGAVPPPAPAPFPAGPGGFGGAQQAMRGGQGFDAGLDPRLQQIALQQAGAGADAGNMHSRRRPAAAGQPYPVRGQADLSRPRQDAQAPGRQLGRNMPATALATFKPSEQEDIERQAGLNGVGYDPRPEDPNLLARIIFAESLNIPGDFAAIGWSTINRVNRQRFRPTLATVLRQPGAFQIVREGNRLGRDSDLFVLSGHPERMDATQRDRWRLAQKVARGILSGQIPDPTGGATYFFASNRYDPRDSRTARGDYRRMLGNNLIAPSKFRTTATAGTRQYFFVEKEKLGPLR